MANGRLRSIRKSISPRCSPPVHFLAATLAAHAKRPTRPGCTTPAGIAQRFLLRSARSAMIPSKQSAVQELERGITGTDGRSKPRNDRRRAKPLSARWTKCAKPFHHSRSPHILRLTDSGLIGLSGTGIRLFIVAGSNPHGALFGAFDLLRRDRNQTMT